MKDLLTILFITITSVLTAQKTDYNTENGYIADGYDVVSYFVDTKPTEGNDQFQTIYDGTKFKFSSEKNLNLFKQNPVKYIPQYGGYCAYAIATKNKKMYIDAEAYEIRDGKLYLFYNTWFSISNTLDTWQESNTKELQSQGDKNWKTLRYQ